MRNGNLIVVNGFDQARLSSISLDFTGLSLRMSDTFSSQLIRFLDVGKSITFSMFVMFCF